MTATFTPEQIEYLRSQPLGRLATARADGTLQNNPVGFRYNPEHRTIDIAGWKMGASYKFRNLAHNNQIAFIVDDVPSSLDPRHVRYLEIRGTAEALTDIEPYVAVDSREMIRIHPRRIIAFGLEQELPGDSQPA
ncbi:PPOX class F420-dependent oxidoreductase [Nocardia callitridis]|uniref:PPOX class F420-dependent oxidoreductase n=1 Tax=Nocardia callitridis TaxID=648753 RepID=A0ABP9JTG8_9NOCA